MHFLYHTGSLCLFLARIKYVIVPCYEKAPIIKNKMQHAHCTVFETILQFIYSTHLCGSLCTMLQNFNEIRF